MCKKSYKTKLWDKRGFFEFVFTNYPRTNCLRNISLIQQDLLDILRLRNRIFHHENILNRNKTPKEQYKLILNILHLLSSETETLLKRISRFETIIKQEPWRLCDAGHQSKAIQ